jgi:hypothetical protein
MTWGGHLVAEDVFERLLSTLPDIAKAVNQFESPAVQEQAFEALTRALGLGTVPTVEPVEPPFGLGESTNGDLDGESGDVDETETTTTTTRRRRRRAATTTVSAERNIDFRPQGKQSFRDFVAEKKPRNQHERNVVAVYYLEKVLSLPSISAGHVLAAYKECNWREPASPVNSLQVTASTRAWLDTKNMTAIHTTPSGRNTVEHDMPFPPTKKKSGK